MKIYPKNKKRFLKSMKFCKEIIKELKIKPTLWGGLAYFYYTKNKNYSIKDIDLLISFKEFPKIIEVLKEKRIKYKYLPKWKLIIITKGKLKIDLDTNEMYYKKSEKLKEVNFNGLKLKIVGLKSLIRMYKRASKTSKDKPEQHKKRLVELKSLR